MFETRHDRDDYKNKLCRGGSRNFGKGKRAGVNRQFWKGGGTSNFGKGGGTSNFEKVTTKMHLCYKRRFSKEFFPKYLENCQQKGGAGEGGVRGAFRPCNKIVGAIIHLYDGFGTQTFKVIGKIIP